MRSFLLNGRMALRRRASCLLILLFSMLTTVFLLVYPRLIDSTRAELDYAYSSIQVSGWLLNNSSYEDPNIDSAIWHELLDTGCIGAHYSYATAEIKLLDAFLIQSEAGSDPSDADLEAAFATLTEVSSDKQKQFLLGLNVPGANDALARQAEDIQWLEGYDGDCLSGSEMVCLLPESLGYQPGDRVPLRLRYQAKLNLVCLQVVGVYPTSLNDNICALVPLQTLEDLFSAEEWKFTLKGFSFIVQDNRELSALKDKLIELKLDGSSLVLDVRAAIDDRILEGTVAPIQSNLSMLEGLYRFFFVAVAVIGFFLCFLQAKSRKPEYAVMRLLGESAAAVTAKALLEQLVLCLTGILLGAVLLAATELGSFDPAVCGIILLCYALGAAVAVLLTVRVNVMEILRDKE